MNLAEVLQYHAQRYPNMKPADVVKLVYQNEFGSGHTVTDPEETLQRIRAELLTLQSDHNIPLTEPLGDGYVRVNLAAIGYHGITPEQMNEMFIRSTRVYVRNTYSYRHKLQQMEELHAQTSLFAFSGDELKKFMDDYARRGYPYPSHSPEFRNLYHPAYRVIREELLR